MNDIDNDIAEPTVTDEDRSAPPQRRLVRYPDRGPGAGVAEGLGTYFGLDPVIFRIAFVLLAFAGGSGILLYLVAWVLIPAAEPGEVPAAGARLDNDQLRTWAGIGLIVVAGVMLLSGPFHLFESGLVWALVLIGGGLLLFQADRNRQDPPVEPADQEGAAPPPSAPQPPPAPQPLPAPQPPSPVGRITAGVALIAAGFAAMLDYGGLVDMSGSEYVALLLTVVGGGLLVAAWWGRATALIGAGLVLLVLLAGQLAAGQAVHVSGGVGERHWAPTNVTDVDSSYELFAGEAVLDLSEVELTGRTEVSAGVTFGMLTVVVPRDVTVRASAQVTGGEIDLLGARASGLGVDRTVSDPGPPGAPELELDLRAFFGEILVRRAN